MFEAFFLTLLSLKPNGLLSNGSSLVILTMRQLDEHSAGDLNLR